MTRGFTLWVDNNGAEVCILQSSAPAIAYLMIVTVPSLRGTGDGVSPAL